MKIYRYCGRPVQRRDNDYEYQYRVAWGTKSPGDYKEYHSHEANSNPYYFFGFTKKQLIRANRKAKRWFRRSKKRMNLMNWNPKFKLRSFHVDDKFVLVLRDQVIFHVGAVIEEIII